jgi:prepilin signal peptidase PulO-like enzyme (type II secretory pathway)
VRVLEDDDVVLERVGRLVAVEPHGGAHLWRIELDGLTEAEDEHLFVFRHSNRYVPFGPFLALGGAACLLAPTWIWWLVTDAYPAWVRGGR